MISLKTHSVVDYCLGVAFLLTPYLFGFDGWQYAHDVFTAIGIAIFGYSLLTDYPYSIAKSIPLRMHMTFDVVAGVFTVIAPGIYGYRDDLSSLQSIAHWILGFATISAAILTGTGKEPRSAVLTPESEFFEEQERSKEAA